MDPNGHIYALSEEAVEALDGIRGAVKPKGLTEALDEQMVSQFREDVARLDGYLRGRADSDRPLRGAGSNRDLAG